MEVLSAIQDANIKHTCISQLSHQMPCAFRLSCAWKLAAVALCLASHLEQTPLGQRTDQVALALLAVVTPLDLTC